MINSTNLTSTGTVTSANMTIMYDLCVACPMNCRTCSGSICLFCASGYQYMEGACVDVCPAMYFGSQGMCHRCGGFGNCLNCTTSSCLLCRPGLEVVNGMCQPTCTLGSTLATCQFNCSNPCASCFGPNPDQCYSCATGVLAGSSCLSSCAERQYLNTSANRCEMCPEGCAYCTQSRVCTQCYSGFYMHNQTNNCVRLCPSSLFPYISTSMTNGIPENYCVSCSPGCIRCINATFCLLCDHNYTLFNFQCTVNNQNYY